MEQPDKILFFDGVCNLCNGLVNFIIRHDSSGKIRFAPLQSDYASEFLSGKNIDSDTVVYLSGTTVYVKSDAVLKILKDMGRGWRLLHGFIIIPRFVRNWFYDIIAQNRFRIFGRRDSCIVPTGEVRSRFF